MLTACMCSMCSTVNFSFTLPFKVTGCEVSVSRDRLMDQSPLLRSASTTAGSSV